MRTTLLAATAAVVVGLGMALAAPLAASADTVTPNLAPGGGSLVHPSIALTTDGSTLYAASSSADEVTQIDTATGAVVQIPTTVPGAAPTDPRIAVSPTTLALSPDGSKLYVEVSHGSSAPGAQDGMIVIDTATRTIVDPEARLGSSFAGGIAVAPDGSRVYLAASNPPSQIDVYTPSTGAITPLIGSAGGQPRPILLSPDGNRLYVAHFGVAASNIVDVYDTATGAKLVTITLAGSGRSEGLALSPDGTRLYVARTAANTIDVVDTATDTIVTTITGVGTGPRGIAVTPDGTRAYVTTNADVAVVDLGTDTVSPARLAVGATPYDVVISRDGRFGYVMNEGSATISKIALDVAPAITTTALPSGAVDGAYSATVTATGTPVPALSQTGTLPPGLTFDPATGAITGTPTTAGSYTVTITATSTVSGTPMTVSKTFTIVIGAAGAAGPADAGGGGAALAETGVNAVPILLVGGGVLLLGVIALVVSLLVRRRRQADGSTSSSDAM